jgi:hypothetical protein
MAIKNPKPTEAVPNPLHRFASYTYSWKLWWLSDDDEQRLSECTTVEQAMSLGLGVQQFGTRTNSFVVAQDGGTGMGNRQPGTRQLNYHIQEVQFETTIGPNRVSKSSNMVTGSMTIIEPYGVTLIDTLIAASFDGQKYNNYTEQSFLLELEFRGYDDNGNEIPKNETSVFAKRFPIRILNLKLQIGNQGAEYKLDFVPTAGSALIDTDYANTPENFNITAGTVGEFFDNLSEKYYDYYADKVSRGQINLADQILFDIEEEIKNSSIVNDKQVSLTNANARAGRIDFSKSTFTIPRGTHILDIITKVMAHSDYLINKQLGLEKQKTDADQTSIFSAFKTLCKVEFKGININGDVVSGVADVRRGNQRPKTVKYNIVQYKSWDPKHPAAPLFADSNPYTSKIYNYYYTGQNTDVIEFKLNFDTTYFTSVLNYTEAVAAENSTENTELDRLRTVQPVVSLNPAIFAEISPQIGLVPNTTPLRYKLIVGDQNLTTGMNTSGRPAAQVANDVINSIYTAQTGDMIGVTMTIVGDPTLIKQDEWLYVPDVDDSEYDEFTQFDFADRYGHIRMDNGDVIARVNINSPIDMDLDITNEGVAFPQPRYTQSLFSGQYKILRITNRFANGKFEQVLNLVRYMNSDLTTAFSDTAASQRTDPVKLGIDADKQLVPTNTTTTNDNTPDQPFRSSGIPPVDNYREPTFSTAPQLNSGPVIKSR